MCVSAWRRRLTSIATTIIKIRRCHGRLTFIMGSLYLKRRSLFWDGAQVLILSNSIYEPKIQIIWKYLLLLRKKNHQTRPEFCIYHGCSAVGMCRGMWLDLVIGIMVTTKIIFTRFNHEPINCLWKGHQDLLGHAAHGENSQFLDKRSRFEKKRALWDVTVTSNGRHGVSNYRSIECLFTV